jgi:hypothetical protein
MVLTVSYDTARQKNRGVRGGGKNALQHNNGMHPTANSVALIRKTPCLFRFVAAGDAWR